MSLVRTSPFLPWRVSNESEHFRLARKCGLISEDDDQIDDDNTRYANYEYAQEATNTRAQVTSPMNSPGSTEPPPAYEFVPPKGDWSNDIRDKDEPNSQVRGWPKPKIHNYGS